MPALQTTGKDPLLTSTSYEMKWDKCELRIEGMTCGSCVEVSSLAVLGCAHTHPSQSIEGMLRTQPGIHSVKVALLAERGVIEYDPTVWTADKIINVTLAIVFSLRFSSSHCAGSI